MVLRPAKPCRTLHFYGLFRGHTGTAWFDDFDVRAVAVGDGALFDGLPVMPGERLQGVLCTAMWRAGPTSGGSPRGPMECSAMRS